MDAVAAQFGRWEVECLPADGGRLRALRFAGHDLLTAPPDHFLPPVGDFGEYETRPVYGYDDCFPSVDPCELPGYAGVRIRDHGELCWLPWAVDRGEQRLTCVARASVGSPVEFTRTLRFSDATLTWRFEVRNEGTAPVPFLHVMHALMPVARVAGLELPDFAAGVDEMSASVPDFRDPAACAGHLLALPWGQATMLLLRGVREGRFGIVFEHGLRLAVDYDAGRFPTLGVWWNRGGYPGEEATRRSEIALEPISGTWSSLERSWADGACKEVGPGARESWEIVWSVSV